MFYKDNDERSSRIKNIALGISGIAVGAFLLKDSGNTKFISKAIGDISKTVRAVSDDLSTKAFKELTADTISDLSNKHFRNADSTWKSLRRQTNNIELEYGHNLFSSLLKYTNLSDATTSLQDEMVDAMQKNSIIQDISSNVENKDDSFFKELINFVDESLKNKSSYFEETEDNSIRLVQSAFEDRINGTILESEKDNISSVMESAINKAQQIKEDINTEFKDKFSKQIAEVYKEEIINEYSDNQDFFKATLDRAATVNDLLKANNEGRINITNGTLNLEGEKQDVFDFLESFVNQDDRFGNLIIDKSTLRVNRQGEIYSLKDLNDLSHNIKEGFADTIAGKLFMARSWTDIKKAPDFFYMPQGSWDPILSNLEKAESGFLKEDHFKIGKNIYKYANESFTKVEGGEDLYLVSGQHGSFNVLMNRIYGNIPERQQDNYLLKALDIGTSGHETVIDSLKSFVNKFDKDSDWIKSVRDRLYNRDYYTEDNVNNFIKDIKAVNRFYNDKTFAPSNKTLSAINSLNLTTESRNILEAITNNDIEQLTAYSYKYNNKDLSSLVNKYKQDKSIVKSYTQIGFLGEKQGVNVLKFNDAIKREGLKEVLLREAIHENRSQYNLAQGLGIVHNRLDNLKLSGADKHNLNNLFNWSILQQTSNAYNSQFHRIKNIEEKLTDMRRFQQIIFGDSDIPQTKKFLDDFKNNVSSFINKNSSIFDKPLSENKKVIGAINNNEWMTLRKTINPLDIIKSANDEIKFRSTVKKFGKQFFAGRNNLKDMTTATLFPYHFFNRLVTPMDELFLGFSGKNTKSTLDLAKNIGLKRILPAIGLVTAASYLDYESENLTGTSFGQAYQNAKANFGLGLKTIQQGIGLDDNMRRSRMYNPIAKYWLGEYKDKDEYLDYLENGYDPVRKGRWWSFGSASEFRGGKISYWEPNKLRQAYSHYKDVSLYGSVDEKWKHSWIPTPRHPLSTIRNLLDPYWLERKHYWDRPYPVTGKLFDQETPWGAILNPTIGQLIKPQRRMHQAELQGTLVDVRTLIANRNKEIRDKATANRMGRLDESGFTNIQYNPYSMPSLNENVLSLQVNNGKITSMGYEGQHYPDTLPTLEGMDIEVMNPKDVRGLAVNSVINHTNSDSVSSSLINDMIMSLVPFAVSSGAIEYGTAKSVIQNINNQLKAKEYSDSGVIIEKTKYPNNAISASESLIKNKFLSREELLNIGSKKDFVSDIIYSGKQLSGMYGFLWDTIIPSKKGYQLEQAGRMNSFVRSFWDESIGGWGGDFMEIARRFFPHENHDITQINPIRNTMPEWLPENFHTGDPYTKVTKGEARLPGAGYESLNKLHPDKYGRYGAFDRYKILADVSPGSEEYKIWKKIVKDTIKDPKLIKESEQIEKRVAEQSKSHDFYNYKFLHRNMKNKLAVIENVTNTGKFTINGSDQVYSLAGIKPLTDENKQSYVHQYLKPGMVVKLSYEDNDYRKFNSNHEIPTLVNFGGTNITKEMWEKGQAKENTDKETLADELFAASETNKLLGPAIELIAHFPVPYLHNKFLRIDSPMESYQKEQVYGTSFSTWEHPIKGFIQPTFQNAWSKGPLIQGLGIATWYLSNKAIEQEWNTVGKTLAHAAFAATNPGAVAGGILAYIPRMAFGKGTSKVFNVKNGANVGAAVGLIGYGFANLDNPFLSIGNFAVAGGAIANQLKFKNVSNSKGMLIGAAVGLGLSALKNPEFSLNKLTEKYIPKDTKKKWEIEEYFDRLEYIKYTNLYKRAAKQAKDKEHVDIEKLLNKYDYLQEQNTKQIKRLQKQRKRAEKYIINQQLKSQTLSNIDRAMYTLTIPDQYFKLGEYSKSAIAYKKAADTTIYGLKANSSQADVLRALPKYDRDYFLEFAKEKDPKERKKILKNISPYKQKALKILWGEDIDKEESNKKFFSRHNLPNLFWSGWQPQIDLENVKIKTIENEGMLLSDFGIYESAKDEPAYDMAPEINNMNDSSTPFNLQKDLLCLLNGIGLQNVNVSVEQTSASGIQMITNIARTTQYDLKQTVSNIFTNIF